MLPGLLIKLLKMYLRFIGLLGLLIWQAHSKLQYAGLTENILEVN